MKARQREQVLDLAEDYYVLAYKKPGGVTFVADCEANKPRIKFWQDTNLIGIYRIMAGFPRAEVRKHIVDDVREYQSAHDEVIIYGADGEVMPLAVAA